MGTCNNCDKERTSKTANAKKLKAIDQNKYWCYWYNQYKIEQEKNIPYNLIALLNDFADGTI